MSENKTIEFFNEISKIPRESGNEMNISEYICEFAKNRKLEYIQDEYKNVIIKKNNGTNEPIILQAHMDMVCEKEENLDFDFEQDSINVYEEKGYLKARGTTLGADNGIGVAQILNILDSEMQVNIEAIFTAEEETTMIGAEKIDVSMLKGRKLINLDAFNEKTITIESASFFDIILHTNYTLENSYVGKSYKIFLTGMPGGHSGFEIDKENGNSSIELAKMLQEIKDIRISEFVGGTKFNVIPSSVECTFCSNINKEDIENITIRYKENLSKKYKNIQIIVNEVQGKVKWLSNEESRHFLNAVISFKHGVFNKNENGQVTTSANLGVVNLTENIFKIGARSSKIKEQETLLEYLKEYCDYEKFKLDILGTQPGFETSKEAELIKVLVRAYKNINNGEEPKLESVHITVEAGFFKDKIPDLQVAIISPSIIGAHTVNECVDIKSIEECDKWLEETICLLNK